MSDQFEIMHTDETYEVELRVVKKCREFVAVKTYNNIPKEASQPAVSEVEIESIHFSQSDKQTAINRAIKHLNIVGEFE